MAGENTVATLNGLFKTVYAEKLIDLIPDYAVLQKRVEFVPAAKETGAFYAQPVVLSHESGFTYNGTAGGVATLNNPSNGVMKEAQVYGSELILRTQMSYASLARAASAGARAFKRASAFKVEDMNNAMRKRLEIAMLYGQDSLGIVSVNSGGTTSYTLTISDASWAGGIWAGAEGAVLDVFNTGKTTRRNTAALTVSSVDSDNKQIVVAATSGELDTCVATDVIAFRGAVTATPTYSEMAGLKTIISNTGTLFNIAANTYSLWKGSVVSSVGQISFTKLQDAVGKAVNKGLMEKVLVLVSPKAWAVLNSDQAALRMFDGSYGGGKKFENGGESLMFHSVNGPMEVVCHPMVKDGEAFVLPPDSLLRVGSVDMSFSVPGFDEQFFQLVPGYGAVELQCYADQAIFCERPAHAALLTGITYT